MVISRPGAPERRGEEAAVAIRIREMNVPNLHVFELTEPATLDGGDVLVMGTRVFIGLSRRTNAHAVEQARGFLQPLGFEVHGVPMPPSDTCLHLKSLVSQLDARTLCLVEGALGDAVLQHIQGYDCVRVPDMLTSNVLRICDTVFYQVPSNSATKEKSRQRIVDWCKGREGLTAVELSMAENAKADGALTCCSVLL